MRRDAPIRAFPFNVTLDRSNPPLPDPSDKRLALGDAVIRPTYHRRVEGLWPTQA
jgi:hypothetical protein